MSKALAILHACAQFAFRIPEKIRPTAWLNRHVVIPPISGAMEPGPLDTSRNPPMEGLLELVLQPHVHFFTLPKSGRVGGSLLAICVVLHQLGTNPGPILWVDPSRSSARQLFRREIEPFILACKPVAEQAIIDKEHWTASLCFFKGGSFLRMAGAGSPNELAGYQARVVILNEGDKVHHNNKGEAPAHDLAIVRTKQFTATRKILENSTPADEFGIWTRFLKGSQHYCYVPCPHCSTPTSGFQPPEQIEPGRSPYSYDPGLRGWQRLSFFGEESEVPFDEDLNPLPEGKLRPELTGRFKFDHCRITETREVEPGKFEPVPIGWDYEKVLKETRYECAHCGKQIEQKELPWMVKRYRWMAHHLKAPTDRISAHIWAAYCPLGETPDTIWGEIAKKFVLAGHDSGALHDFYNNDLGKPWKAISTEVDETDIEKLQKASPRFLLRTLPSGPEAGGWVPEYLTMTADVQKQTGAAPFWHFVMAWGIAWDLPGWPTVGVLADYGPAAAWSVIEEIAAISPNSRGEYNEYLWRNTQTGEERRMRVFAGLVDSGDQAQREAEVYEFCLRNRHLFEPSKGGSRAHCGGERIRSNEVYNKQLVLQWYWSDVFTQTLYRRIIKERKELRWLPADLDPEFIAQLTDEHTVFKNGRLIWEARTKNNHLGDAWKMQEVIRDKIEPLLEALRQVRRAEIQAAEAAAAAAPAKAA